MRKLVLALFVGCVFQASAQTSNFKKEIEQAKDSIKNFVAKRGIAGAAVAISVNGKIILAEGYGYADVENKVPVNPFNTKFRIGSIAKSLTATALGKLIEENKIILDSSVYYYLSNYPTQDFRFTIRQLGGHIAGVRHYNQNEFLISKRYHSVTEGLTIFENDPLLFAPGSKYSYSSFGFNLLSAAMEKASNTDFLVLMKQKVFTPLEMKNTVADYTDSLISNRTGYYEIQKGSWLNSPYVDNSYKLAGGGYLSTCEDLIKLAESYVNATYLKKETIDLLTTSQKLANGEKTGYGIGWRDGNDSKNRRWVGHTGGSVGGSSALVIYPNEKIVVVMLTNVSGANLGRLPGNLAQLFIK